MTQAEETQRVALACFVGHTMQKVLSLSAPLLWRWSPRAVVGHTMEKVLVGHTMQKVLS